MNVHQPRGRTVTSAQAFKELPPRLKRDLFACFLWERQETTEVQDMIQNANLYHP